MFKLQSLIGICASFPEGHVLKPGSQVAAASSFFKLPPELRDMIYMFAFGGRVVHMELQPTIISLYQEGTLELRQQKEPDSDSEVDERVWHWWSSVCYRNPSDEAYNDACRRRWARSLIYPEECPGKHSIGIMGWLLGCRQA